MLVKSMTEEEIYEIGHAFGYYDYGEETGMSAAFSGKEATANYICAYGHRRKMFFYIMYGVDFIAAVFLCAMILFGDTGAQPAACKTYDFTLLFQSINTKAEM